MNTRGVLIVAGFLAACCLFAPAAKAVMLTDSLVFPANTVAKDERSGNGIDYVYSHKLILPDGASLLSGKLRLTHSGNADDSPRGEVWWALGGAGTFLGKLAKSEPGPITEEWVLPVSVLEALSTGGWQLPVSLSEQTVFNSEQVRLHRSDLEVEYAMPQTRHAAAPEPGTASLAGAGLILAGLLRRRRKISA